MTKSPPTVSLAEGQTARTPHPAVEVTEKRAREVLAREYEASTDAPAGSGIRFHAANVRVMGKRDYADWKDRAAIRAMLAFAKQSALTSNEQRGDREAIAQIVARAYGGSLYPGHGVPGDYPTDDVDYRAADAIISYRASSQEPVV